MNFIFIFIVDSAVIWWCDISNHVRGAGKCFSSLVIFLVCCVRVLCQTTQSLTHTLTVRNNVLRKLKKKNDLFQTEAKVTDDNTLLWRIQALLQNTGPSQPISSFICTIPFLTLSASPIFIFVCLFRLFALLLYLLLFKDIH